MPHDTITLNDNVVITFKADDEKQRLALAEEAKQDLDAELTFANEGRCLSSEPATKSYEAEIKADDDEEGTFTATITTGAIDRDHEIIVAKGISFENFLKRPTVLFGHDHTGLPIGKALWVKSARGGKIIAKVRVAPTEFAQEVLELIKGGFLGAVSIGFRPTGEKSGPPKPEEVKKNPDWADARWIYREVELLEFSVVNVPANPEALITAVGKGAVSLSKEMSDVLSIDMSSPVQTIMRLEQEISRLQLAERVQSVKRIQSVERFLTDGQITERVGRALRRKLGRAY